MTEGQQDRPVIGGPAVPGAVEGFLATLQDGIDRGDADRFNERFAADVLWGSPFGAVVDGYEAIHEIHASMFQPRVPGDDGGEGSTYSIEHVRFPADDVAIASVRRTTPAPTGELAPGQAGGFDELALFVLVRRDGTWWLAAGQHVPDRRREMYG